MSQHQGVAIIIVHYNSEKVTLECLASLEKIETSSSLNIVVVDNGSKQPLNLTSKPDRVELIRSEKNLGFTGGNNLGIEFAFEHFSPKYILLLNNDTIIDPHFLDTLVEFAESHPDVGTVSPKIYFERGYEFHKKEYSEDQLGKVIWFAGGSIDWKNIYGFHRGVDEVDYGQFDLPTLQRNSKEVPYFGYATMDFASGCCVLIPSAVLQKVGLFDDSYFLYWEDVDLSVRIRQAGYQLYFEPKAVIWHKNAGSSGGSGSALQQKFQKKNRVKFALKYAPVRSKLAVLKEYFLK